MFSRLQGMLETWLAEATRRTLAQEKPIIIAMTGSVGKSTTRQAIAAFLGANQPGSAVRASAKNYNNELGLPLTVFDESAPGRSLSAWARLVIKAYFTSHGWRKTGVSTFVLEMGADKQGDIAHLTRIAPPDIAIVTAVTPEDASLPPVHLANYPSVDALAEEKSTLARRVKPNGIVVLNADDPRVFAMRHLTSAQVRTYGETDAADIRITARKIRTEERSWGREPVGLEIDLQIYNRHESYFIPRVFGRSTAYAWAAALGVADALDASQEMLGSAATRFAALPGRTRIVQGRDAQSGEPLGEARRATANERVRELLQGAEPTNYFDRAVLSLYRILRDLGKW
jgi:UDP-N-acetylmuramoyl-tripeptide--D-alanyl-D-alanine ligase